MPKSNQREHVKYFAVGFGYVCGGGGAGKNSGGSVNFFEQVLDSHGAGYSLQASWVVE